MQGGGEPIKPAGGECGEQAGEIVEMVFGGGVGDADGAGGGAQRQGGDALAVEQGFGGVEQGGAQIAMVIGLGHGRSLWRKDLA